MKTNKKFKLSLNKETLSNMENVIGGDKKISYMNYTCVSGIRRTCQIEATKAKPCSPSPTLHTFCGGNRPC